MANRQKSRTPASKKPAGREDTATPGSHAELLILVSSRKRLRTRYGAKGLEAIDDILTRYRERLSGRGVELVVAFVDDASSLSTFGIEPLKRITPLSAKRTTDRLIARFSRSHKGNVSLLILGGHEVLPHFSLANPAYDSDEEVLSDNPYGCKPGLVKAEQSLLPELPVGRMPDGDGASIDLLLRQIDTSSHTGRLTSRTDSLGYTAKVWDRASKEVWRSLGSKSALKVSPPSRYLDVNKSWFDGKRFLYFNLHGSDRAPYWFGQKGQSFPTALSPGNVSNFNSGRNVVVTEACYGAIEAKRSRRTSIALAFMASGSACVAGSTCIAYGALVPPVSEADLIALHFLLNVKKGLTFGGALVNARAQLAAAAVARQGYLDEDDRKTLLQFVLFGDPTLRLKTASKPARSLKSRP